MRVKRHDHPSIVPPLLVPGEATEARVAEAAAAVGEFLGSLEAPVVRLRLSDPERGVEVDVAVPAGLVGLLLGALDALRAGRALRLETFPAELSMQQAAELLGVSRDHVTKLLEQGQLSCRRSGGRRRVRLVGLLAFKRQDDERRAAVLAELTREAEDLGLYS